VLARSKGNLGPPVSSLAFRIEAAGDASRVVWEGESHHTAASLLREPAASGARPRAQAGAWLEEFLTEGRQGSTEVRAAAEAAGLSWGTVRRAAEELRVRRFKTGMKDGWVWELRPKVLRSDEGAHSEE
jgi:hypothetical protein